jgi:drug/metabolite transporter (DMT)-like permease
MSWFILTLICMLGWGCADLFYKKSNVDGDRYSHLKTAVWVGMMMGLFSLFFTVCTLCREPLAGLVGEKLADALCAETLFTPGVSIFGSAVKYLPASLGYIISMVVGYAGMRYLEVSIVSPVQNASGALSAIAMLVYFTAIGKIAHFWDEYSVLDVIGTVMIVAGVIALGIVEQRLAKAEGALNIPKNERKYRYGALALIFPILYCVFDTIGTTADGIILNDENGLGDIDVLILYGFTFFLAGIIAWIFLLIKEKKAYNPFGKGEIKTRGAAALFEQFGQIFYVYAMSENPVVAAPMIASYCIVSAILSRIFLKEKLRAAQYACIAAVIAGIVLLGVSEGLAEA